MPPHPSFSLRDGGGGEENDMVYYSMHICRISVELITIPKILDAWTNLSCFGKLCDMLKGSILFLLLSERSSSTVLVFLWMSMSKKFFFLSVIPLPSWSIRCITTFLCSSSMWSFHELVILMFVQYSIYWLVYSSPSKWSFPGSAILMLVYYSIYWLV